MSWCHSPLWGQSTGHQCISLTQDQWRGLLYLCYAPAQSVFKSLFLFVLPKIRDAMTLIWHHCNDYREYIPWWRHQMETFSALLAICAGNSPVTGEFPTQRPMTRIFDMFFDLRLNKRLSKQSWSWLFETPLRPLWRHCNDRGANGDELNEYQVHAMKRWAHPLKTMTCNDSSIS